MVTNTRVHNPRIRQIDAVARSRGTETFYPCHLSIQKTCPFGQQAKPRSPHTGMAAASADSAAAPPATRSGSLAEFVRRMAAHRSETEFRSSYRDDPTSRIAMDGITRQHTRRGPPSTARSSARRRMEKDKRKGIGDQIRQSSSPNPRRLRSEHLVTGLIHTLYQRAQLT